MLLLAGCAGGEKGGDRMNGLQCYDVRWSTPGGSSLGSMPLGNGDIGMNVWVEDNGDICFYISKTDAWDENGRLVKIGKVRLTLAPEKGKLPPFTSQTLDLESATVEVVYGKGEKEVRVSLWADANHPVIAVDVAAPAPVTVTAVNEMWRTRPDTLEYIVHGDVMYDKRYKNGSKDPVVVDPDRVIPAMPHAIGWYHHNSRSAGVVLVARRQGVEDLITGDPLLHRTFGAVVTAPDGEMPDDRTLRLKAAKEQHLTIFVHTAHPSTPARWLQEVKEEMAAVTASDAARRREAHTAWWHALWQRSHIFINPRTTGIVPDRGAFLVTRGYLLQRFITACAGRGKYPIKFNGSVFTMDHGRPGGADFRLWGPAYWWQNTRLPYISMCASGDFEMMHPLFKFYVDDLSDYFRKRTERYFGHEGLYLTEEMHIWGTVPMATYGWDSTFAERKDKLQESGYHKYEWVAGLELLYMMLDYYEYTCDTLFLKEKVLPFAGAVLTFFDRHYPTDEQGRLVMHPAQALETWWNCTNPMPELAGLYANTERLLALDTMLTTYRERSFWEALHARLPAIPLREEDGVTMLAPAAQYAEYRNLERPEMYAVFPFHLYGVGRPHIEYARAAMEHPLGDVAHSGWSQEDIFYAYLGETEKARDAVVKRAKGKDPQVRFPAFWGPNFDWTPDQDHGGVLMKAIQAMLLQTDDRKIFLFPAWPAEWDVDFKLHAPYHTVIEGSLRNGEVKKLRVTPPERKDDVVMISFGGTKK